MKGEILLPTCHRVRPYDQAALLAAGILSIGFFKKPRVRIIPTGGVTVQTARAFLDAGCVALGVGGALVSNEILENQDWLALTERAMAFVTAVER